MEPRIWHKYYDDGVGAEVDFEECTLPQYLTRSTEKYGERPALTFLNRTLTYQEFKDHVDRLATALASMGVAKGSRVAIQLPNLPQFVIGYYATLSLGAVAVPTSFLYTPREIEHQWTDAGCDVAILADFIYASRVRSIRERLPVRHYVIASVPEYLRFPLNILAPLKLRRLDPPLIAKVEAAPGVHFFRKTIEATPPEPPDVEIGFDDTATLLYTGGTTGVSKGATLTHQNLSCNVQQVRTWLGDIEFGHEVVLGALPLFHSFGLTTVMNNAVSLGAAMVLVPNPRDIPAIIKNVVKHRVTMFPAVPTHFNSITQQPGIEKVDLRSIKVCVSGSAPLPVDVLQRFERLTGSKISEGYGLSETSPCTHCNPLYTRRKVGSIGVPLPNTDIKVVDPKDGITEVPPGEVGELLIKGPQVMQGYWNRPDETAQVLKEGWLATGDLCRVDEDGFHFIVGRTKDMILCSGFNVYPDEIDDVLMAHPGIREAATIGLPDARRGETVKSFVVPEPGQHVTEDEIITYCRDNLAPYKVPKYVEFREELPKSSVLKILRRELRAEEIAKRTK
ncbi:MAG: AMP-binding protein [Gemmatimonadales bacterium]|nr:AMP-binding protein [Gemmatimonadales bacterium]NIP08566.1 AMP-binding protein [Gemmatimonadales bacterium]NIQ99103.1 AMP-binding protein [Gemmatimonadales bacterium]NIS66073.1 AMP-binding protein [Gemmatimonadales bacterium]